MIKNSKDAKTIQQLKETVNRVKHDASVKDAENRALKSTLESLASLAKDKNFGALEEELAAFRARSSSGLAPEPKPKPAPEPESQRERAQRPKKAGELEPEPEPAPKPEPTLETDPEPGPTLPSLSSRTDGAQDPKSATTPPTQP